MLKSLVIPGVRMAADKPVAKREGAFRIFAAPIFFFAIAMLLGGGYIVEDQFSSPTASQSYALFAGAFFIATSITLLAELFHLAKRIAKTRPTYGHTWLGLIGARPMSLALRVKLPVA